MNKASDLRCWWWNRLILYKRGLSRNILLNTMYILLDFLFVELDFNIFLMIQICTYLCPWTKICMAIRYSKDYRMTRIDKTDCQCGTVYSYAYSFVIYCDSNIRYIIYRSVSNDDTICDVVSWMLISELLRSKNEAPKCITDQI